MTAGTSDQTVTVTITDDEAAPTVSFSSNAVTVAEDDGTVAVTLELTHPSANALAIPVSTADETATAGSDYTALTDMDITIAAGMTTQTVSIDITDDNTDENDERFTVNIGSSLPAGVKAGSANGQKVTVTITDDDVPELTFTETTATVVEGVSTVDVTVQLDRSPVADLIIPVVTRDVTATAGSDYTALSSTNVTFAAGTGTTAVTRTVTIMITDDTVDEPDETFMVSFGDLTSLAGRVTAGTDNTATVTITDNDDPMVSLSLSSPTLAENGGTATLTVTLSSAPAANTNITIETAGSAVIGSDKDYTLTPASVTFVAGTGSDPVTQTVTVAAVNDTADEVNETIVLSVDADSITGVNAGTPVSVTATIIDDDIPAVNFDASLETVNEGTTTLMVTVQLSTSPVVPLTIPVRTSDSTARAGLDYTALTTESVSFEAGTDTLTGTVSITIADDDIDEPNETFTVFFGTLPAGVVEGVTAPRVTVTIFDNDPAPTGPIVSLELPAGGMFGFPPPQTSITEAAGGREIIVTVSLSEALADEAVFPLTIDGTAMRGAGNDYTLSAPSVTIAAGVTSGTVTVTALDDNMDELTETIILSVDASGLTGVSIDASSSVTITLMDNDEPIVSFASATAAAAEGTPTVAVTVQLDISPAVDLSIPVMTVDGTARAGIDYTALTSTRVIFTADTTTLTQTVPISIIDDDADDNDETFTVSFGTLPGGVTEGATDEVTVTITDNDDMPAGPIVTVALSHTRRLAEIASSSVIFMITLSEAPAREVTIPIIAAGTATLGTDYTLGAPSVTFTPSGATTQRVEVRAVDDRINDPDETIILSVDASGIEGVSNGATTIATTTINDGGELPELSLSWGPGVSTLEEGSSTPLTVTINPPFTLSNLNFYLDFGAGNTATANTSRNSTPNGHVRFSSTPSYNQVDNRFNRVSMPAGASTRVLTLESSANLLTQNETLVVTLIPDPTLTTASYTISETAGSARLTLVNDVTAPAAPVSNFMVTDASTTEGSTRTLRFNVNWTEPMLPDDYANTVIRWRTQGSSTAFTDDNRYRFNSLCTPGGFFSCDTLPFTLPTVGSLLVPPQPVLTAGTYDVQIFVQDRNSNRSTVVTETITLVDLPAVPTALSATASSDSQIDLTWTAPSGTVTGYLVEVSPDGNTNTFNPVASAHTGTSATYSHAGLTAGTEYHYRVSAINSAGTGMPSDVAMATTQAAAANPTVSLSLSDTTIAEDGGTSTTLTVTLSAAPASEVTILVMVDDTSTATRGTGNDYTLSSTSLIFGTSDTTKTVTITALDDSIDDEAETIILSVNADNIDGVDAGTTTSVMVTITDDDEPAVPAITITGGSTVTEGTAATFTVTASPAPANNLTVNLSADDGAGDFIDGTPPTTVTISTTGTATLSVPTDDDNTDEADGTITVTLASGTGYTIAEPAPSAMVTITDNDGTPTVDFSATAVTVAEGDGTAVVTLELSGPSATALVIPVSTGDGVVGTSATAGSDYTALTAMDITIAAGLTTQTVSIDITDDNIDESDETFTVSIDDLTSVAGVTAGSSDGTAEAGSDYTALTAMDITIAAGMTTQTVSIDITDDNTDEADERFTVNIGSSLPEGVKAGSSSGQKVTVTITDDDEVPDAPTGLTATAVGAIQVSLSWMAPVNSGSSEITGYRIQESTTDTDPESFSDLVADTTSTATTYDHTSLTAGTTHHYRVFAISAAGVGSASSTATAITAADGVATAPGMPTALMARATGSSMVELSWTAPANDGGSTVTGYRIESATTGGSFTDLLANTANVDPTYTHTGVVAQIEYTYRVSAINAEGAGLVSDVATIITVDAPQNLQARPVGADTIQLRWREPSTINNFVITGYQLEFSTDGTDFTGLQTLGSEARAYSHSGLTVGAMRHYRIYATHEGGRSDATAVVMATTAAVTPSSPPRNLMATASSATQIDLSWTVPEDNGGSDITGYRIAVSTSGGPNSFSALVEDTGDITTTYSHTDLSAGVTRYYRVLAINGAATNRGRSLFSDVAMATTNTIPDAPTGLTAMVSGPNQIDLGWTAPEDDGGSTITGYRIQVSTTNTNSGSFSDLVVDTMNSGTTYRHAAGLIAGTTYHYRVAAINAVTGTMGALINYSATATATAFTVPDAPTGLTATASSATQIDLSWTAPAYDGDSPITGYRIQVSTTNTNSASFSDLVEDTEDTDTIYEHTHTLAAGATRYYRVLAINSAGISIASAVAMVTTGIPAAPRGLIAMASSFSQIDLSWTAPEDNGSSSITGYLVEVSTDGGSSFNNISPAHTGTDRSYSHTDLDTGTERHYRVSAINEVGRGPVSSIASAATFAVPDAPTDLIAMARSDVQINLSWAAPVNMGSSSITSYLVEFSTDSGANYNVLVAHNRGTTYAHVNLSAATAYMYRVSAINAVGTSTASSTVTATTLAAMEMAPDAPTGLTATAVGATQVSLSWMAPVNSGSSEITGYRIQESTTDTDPESFSDLVADTTSTTGTATTYDHTSLTAGTTHHYRVFAISAAGEGRASSTATATTAADGVATAPGMPTALTARATGSSMVELNWTAPANDGGSTVTGYRVESTTTGSFTDLQANTANADTTYTHMGVFTLVEYTYRVSAINAEGEGLVSEVATIITVDAPQMFQARPVGADTIQLRWREPSAFNIVITGYQLEVSIDDGNTFTNLQTLGSGCQSVLTHRTDCG